MITIIFFFDDLGVFRPAQLSSGAFGPGPGGDPILNSRELVSEGPEVNNRINLQWPTKAESKR